jgi:hypothetical protein
MVKACEDPRILGYCTNVHAGETLARTKENLERHAVEVRRLHCPGRMLDVGLWLSASAARELQERGGVAEFGAWLAERGLRVFTLNGFPYGDFHRPVVKHDVYRPDWREERRLDYTLDLARILAALLPEGAEGSISTLPVGWGPWLAQTTDLQAAAGNLRRAADALHVLHSQTGRLIHLDLEPEPGCVLQRSADVVAFFENHLSGGSDEEVLHRHVRVCHDVCHAAVMFENQAGALKRYDAAGILVGKVQVSSALRVRIGEQRDDERRVLLAELERFAEPRYLHQTCVRDAASGARRFYEDLPQALAAAPAGEWRVHFHVPVHLKRIGLLRTTNRAIVRCFLGTRHYPQVHHFEVETYAWDVLPEKLRRRPLAESITLELTWSSFCLGAAGCLA